MPVSDDLHVAGVLERGPLGLVLRTDGGALWELETSQRALRLIGQRVEVVGFKTGFNGLVCERIWPAGKPRPKRRALRFRLEYLLVGALVAYGLVATFIGLPDYLR